MLKKWRIRQIEADLELGNKSENNLVFTRDDGAPLRLAYLNEKLDQIIRKHKLHKITIHDTRHSHTSLLFESGATIKEVQERLGHSDVAMTMSIYTHVTDSLKEKTAEKFQRYMDF